MMDISALERGWNVMTYEGPGQPTIRREQDIGFIYDWERVVTPVADYLSNRSDVDMDQLALVGISMGGYFAARAAAFEPRIKALLLSDGVYDVLEGFLSGVGPLASLFSTVNQTTFDEIVNGAIVFNTSAPSPARWGVQHGLWAFNTHSPYEFLKRCQPMTITNISDRIQIPTWIGNPANEFNFPGQPAKVKQALGDRATLHNFTGPASYHCQAGAFEVANQVMFDWLDGVFPGQK
jgi:pimeloyl-ACP methyl ester carboxylesterase